MSDPNSITDATQRVEQGKRLIRDAQLARQKNEPLDQTVQDEIEVARRVSDMMGNLACLIEGMNDSPQIA
jgi:hypothetical protein